jgi:signal peptidase I
MGPVRHTTSASSGVRPPRSRKIWRWGRDVLAWVGLCFILYHLSFEMTVLVSGSMSPTLRGTSARNGDRVLVEKISGWFRSPRRWEVVYFEEEGVPIMKRVVGMPGEKISLKDLRVRINGVELPYPEELPSLKYYAFGNVARDQPVDCGKGYYVLGDDSRDSNDSRFIGVITPDRIRGRAWVILWPSDRIGFVR